LGEWLVEVLRELFVVELVCVCGLMVVADVCVDVFVVTRCVLFE